MSPQRVFFVSSEATADTTVCPASPQGALYRVSPAADGAVWLSGYDFSEDFDDINWHGDLSGWTHMPGPGAADGWGGSGVGRTDTDLWHNKDGPSATTQVWHYTGSWAFSVTLSFPFGHGGGGAGAQTITTPTVVSASEVYVGLGDYTTHDCNLFTWYGSGWTQTLITFAITATEVAFIAGSSGQLWGFGRQRQGGGARNGAVFMVPLDDPLQPSYFDDPALTDARGVAHCGLVLGSDDVWGAGWHTDNVADFGFQPSLWHMTGGVWTETVPPWPYSSGSGGQGELYGIHGVAADDVWAVGYYLDPTDSLQRLLIYHWDGSSWTQSLTPNMVSSGGHDPYLYDVYAAASDDVWAVGEACGRALVLHWDGSAWTEVVLPPL